MALKSVKGLTSESLVMMLRQFHIESFVIQYMIDSISPDKKTMVFVSESIENITPVYRAKETYRLLSDDE